MNAKNWSGLKIKHALELAGCSQTRLARELGLTVPHIHQVVLQGAVSDRVRTAVAAKIGVDKTMIWPEYYLRKSMAA